MATIRVERQIAGRTLVLETGKVAKQAHGAVMVQYGDTVVLATVLSAPSTREVDFFPLYVDYRENQYAAGKVPGGFFKREGRPSTKEILTMRMIDRPIRPLFPDDFLNEVQIQCLVLSTDQQNDPDTLAVIGASAALMVSPAPLQAPIGCARIGYVNGQYVVNPTHDELETSTMDLVVCGTAESVNMVEMGAKEVPEALAAEGIARGFEVCRQVVEMIQEMASKAAVRKEYTPSGPPEELKKLMAAKCTERIRKAKGIVAKVERNQTLEAIREEMLAELCPEAPAAPLHPRAGQRGLLQAGRGDPARDDPGGPSARRTHV